VHSRDEPGTRRATKGVSRIAPERRYELLVDAVVDYAIYMLDPEGYITTWNRGAERLKGYTAEEIIGSHFSRFFSDEQRADGKPWHALRIAAKYGRFEEENWRVRKDGSRFWALAVLDAIHDEHGQLIGFAKITRDMSERQRAQEVLAESERLFRLLVKGVTDYAIFMLDPDGNVTNWNSGAERIKGYGESEIIGRHFSSFYTEEDRRLGKPQEALRQAALTGRFESEGWRVRKNGERFWANALIDAIYDEAGKLIGFAKVTRDITERRQAEKRLEETRSQLAQSQKMEAIGQLTGGVAHDFNNLLMIIIGNLETAERQLDDLGGAMVGRLRRVLGRSSRAAQRAATLTKRLLAFSRRQALKPEPLDVNRFIADCGEFLRRTLGETIDIVTVGGGGVWPIEVDVNELESALLNVALNARDAMPGGGKLTIDVSNALLDKDYARGNPEVLPGQYVVISVTDTGTGMKQETLQRAFDPFFTTKPAGQGTGLGLSQVYGFVKQSGGHIRLYSEPGQGTTVKVYFPRLLGEPASPIEGDRNAETAEGQAGETILLVEDDHDVRTYLLETLRELNYRVLGTQDAGAALSYIERPNIRVDLLLTDVVLPGMNGRELADRARRLRPDLKVLFLTGYSRNAVVHQGRLDAGVELLQKPVRQAELAGRIRDMLDGPVRPM
jgi:PAS domain S-box-containing protein